MIEDELVKLWQSSPNQERIKFERSRLMIDVQSSLDRLHKSIRYRDLREIIATVIVIPVFMFYIYVIPFVLTKIASALIVLWGVYVILRLRKVKKYKPNSLTETYLEYLYKTREYLLKQKHLLDTVLYWFVIPFVVFTLLFFLGFQELPHVTFRKTATLCCSSVVLGIVVYFLNKHAARKHILPQLRKVEELIKVMEEK